MHQPQPILAKNVDLWRWEWQRSPHYAVRSPLEPAKSRKSINKAQEIGSKPQHPSLSPRHRAPYIDIFSQDRLYQSKNTDTMQAPSCNSAQKGAANQNQKTQCCRPEQSGRRSVAASRPSAGKGARPSRRAGHPPGRPTRRHCVGRATAPGRAPGGGEPRPRSSA